MTGTGPCIISMIFDIINRHTPIGNDKASREYDFREALFIYVVPTRLKDQAELLQPVNIFLVEYKLEADGSLCARQSWKEYLNKEEYDRLKPYLQDTLLLHWDGKKFK